MSDPMHNFSPNIVSLELGTLRQKVAGLSVDEEAYDSMENHRDT